MIDLYDVIMASEGIAVADEFAALWGRKISGGYEISTYTGTLPATLQTVAGYLAGYKVWGNTGGVGNEAIVASLSEPLCGIDTYSDILALSTGTLTRRIKKLILDGTESWRATSGRVYLDTLLDDYMRASGIITCICTHYAAQEQVASASRVSEGCITLGPDPVSQRLYIYDTNISTAADFKSYLAAQYAADTPVTMWYVLAEPETSTVTVPSGLTGTIEGYLVQDSVPSPENPIYPTANGVKNVDDTYSIQYGYKLPIISNDTTTDIYIGDTQLAKDEYVDSAGKIYRWADITGLSEPLGGIDTYSDVLELSTGTFTKRIKKLVLTGEEKWATYTSIADCYSLNISGNSGITGNGICSHYAKVEVTRELTDGTFVTGQNFLYFKDVSAQNLAGWKSYLAAQYTAGTPATIWYVLAEPEISSVPVPSGLTGTIEGYLIQDGTPTPEAPIYPSANGVKQEDGTYSIENAYITPTDPPVPLPQIPTFAGETTISYGGAGAQPEKVELKYRK